MLRLYLDPRNWPTALLLLTLRLCHKVLPYKLKIRLCVGIGRLVYRVYGRARHVVRVNLEICFPDLAEAEREKLIKTNFEQWAISLIEIAISWWGDSDGVLDNIEFVGTDHLDKAIAAGNGVILLGAHFSTFELGGLLVRMHIGPETPLHIVFRNQNNDLFNATMQRARLRHVNTCIENKDSRKIVKLVRQKQILWYTADHDHGAGNSVFAPFFGHPAATLKTTSTLAKFTGAAVLVMGTYRNPDNSGYSLRLSPAIEDFPSDDPVLDAARINQLIEQAIKVAPEQYMWTHRRFKTQEHLPKAAVYER